LARRTLAVRVRMRVQRGISAGNGLGLYEVDMDDAGLEPRVSLEGILIPDMVILSGKSEIRVNPSI
jgi:hypothetical protein